MEEREECTEKTRPEGAVLTTVSSIPQSDPTRFAQPKATLLQKTYRVGDSDGEERDASICHAATRGHEEEVSYRFSHLASTVPDSQALQHTTSILISQKPLSLPRSSSPSIELLRDKMHSQSSPHDTQELSASFYETFINAQKILRADTHRDVGGLDITDEVVTHSTARTGQSDHVDLGLTDGPKEDVDGDPQPEPNLNSEPIDFSPTQATQNRLSQFPESQRFKTPATHGKKRRHIGEDEIRSPALPRNPLARGCLSKSPAPALGLSQAFAATQAGSSPMAMRRLSEPISDRPSPQIEMQTRLVAASLSSPLRPISELKQILAEPRSCYKPVKQSQAERDRNLGLRKESSDPMPDQPSDEDDFEEEASIVRRNRREKERAQRVGQRFEEFSSSIWHRVSGRALEEPTKANGPGQRHSVSTAAGRPANRRLWEAQAAASPPQTIGNCEQATEEQETATIVVRGSSQLPVEEDDGDQDSAYARGVQVPETVVRLDRSLSAQDQPDESPCLGRLHTTRTSHSIRDLDSTGNTSKPAFIRSSSPTVAVVNSQPDQATSKRTTEIQSSHPIQRPSSSHILSSALGSFPFAFSLQHQGVSRAESLDEQKKHMRLRTKDESYAQRLDKSSLQHSHAQMEIANRTQQQHDASWKRATFDISPSENVTRQLSTQSRTSSRFETANTHLSNGITTGQQSNPSMTGLRSRSKRRLDNIETPTMSKRKKGNGDVHQITRISHDLEAIAAVGDGAGSSSTSPSQTDSNGVRSVDRHRGSSHETSGTSRPPSSPPTSVLHPTAQVCNKTPIFRPQRTQVRPKRRDNSIWDVEVSPPKSAPERAKMKMVPDSVTRSGSTRRSGLRNADVPKDTSSERRASNSHHVEVEMNPSVTPGLNHTTARVQEAGVASEGIVAPTHVFARFNGAPRGYYPARCIGRTGSQVENTLRYQIRWDEASQDDVDQYGIRWLDLRVGDVVKVNLEGWGRNPFIVRGLQDRVEDRGASMTDIHGHQTVLLAPKMASKTRKSLPSDIYTEQATAAPVSAIYLDTNMWARMRPRVSDFDLIVGPATVASSTPSLSRSWMPDNLSTSNIPRSRTRRRPNLPAHSTSEASVVTPLPAAASGIFHNMTFAISHPSESRKLSLGKIISQHGGTLLEAGFQEMFEQKSEPAAPAPTCTSPQATITKDLSLKPAFSTMGFTALIADRHSRKPKYLQALALNLPCLSPRWLEACTAAGATTDWQPYLLAAGESSALDNAVRSRMLPSPVNPQSARLRDMIALRPNLLAGTAAIVVTGTGKAGGARQPYIFLTQMAGAGRVLQCSSLEKAKALLQRQSDNDDDGDDDDDDDDNNDNNRDERHDNYGYYYQWIFVDEKSLPRARAAVSRITDLAAGLSDGGEEMRKKRKKKEKKKKEKKKEKEKKSEMDQKNDGDGDGDRDRDRDGPRSVKVVGNDFLCQSLILGRLLDGV